MSTMPSKSELKKNLKLLKELLESRPMDLDARMRIARTYRLLDDTSDAVAHYGAVARYLSLAGQPLQAIAVLKELLQIAPRHEETLLFLAKLYARTRAADTTNRGRVAVPILDPSPSADEPGVTALDDGMPRTTTGIWRAIRPASTTDLVVVRDADDVGAVAEDDDPSRPPLPAETPLSLPPSSMSAGTSPSRSPAADATTTPPPAPASSREEDALLRVPLFASLPSSSLTTLGHAMVQLRASAGEVLFREGDPSDSCIVVTRGTARVSRQVVDEQGARELLLRRLEPGDVAGIHALFTAETRQATMVAETDLEYFEIDSVAVAAVVKHDPKARRSLLAAMRDRLLGALFLDVPLFAARAGAERETLKAAFLEKEIEEGDDLFADYDEVDGLWVVVDGVVDVVDAAGAKPTTLRVGDWVACLAASEDAPAGLTGTARAACTVLFLPHKRVHGLLGGRGGAARLRPGQALRPTVVVGTLRR
jgi:CRP-like cAMP-binding protein